MGTNQAKIIELGQSESAEGAHGGPCPCVGALVIHEGELRVDYPGNRWGPLAARTTVTIEPGEARPVLLVFENGQLDRPIVVGLLDPLPPLAPEPRQDPLDLRIDARRLEIEGHDEVVLRCGQASITLRRNGRVLLRGTYVETRAEGVNRIKGGSVQIN